MANDSTIYGAVPLRRRLGLVLLVLYGTGITVGAGIYVLVGAVAQHFPLSCSLIASLRLHAMPVLAASVFARHSALSRDTSSLRTENEPQPLQRRAVGTSFREDNRL
jgi:hypothetical protein